MVHIHTVNEGIGDLPHRYRDGGLDAAPAYRPAPIEISPGQATGAPRLPSSVRGLVGGWYIAQAGAGPAGSLAQPTSTWTDRIISRLRDGPTCEGETEIIRDVRMMPAVTLDAVILDLFRKSNLGWLVRGLGGHLSCSGGRKELLALLTQERVGALSVNSRAALIYALCQGHTDHNEEEAIVRLLEATRGADLTRLKTVVDTRSPYDLEDILHHDIDDSSRRERIVAHISREAKTVSTNSRIVLSDIDDTVARGWKDPRYPNGTVYPGVRVFLAALGESARRWGRIDPTFVTARPEERTRGIEKLTVDQLRKNGFAFPTVLMGQVTNLLTDTSIAAKKVENVRSYQGLFPEFDLVFVGDSGQGDVTAAQALHQDSSIRLKASFIHDVTGMKGSKPTGYATEGKIHFFDTYLGAALAAFKAGLIRREDVLAVARDAFRMLEDPTVIKLDQSKRKARIAEHKRDLLAVSKDIPLPPDLAKKL